MKSKEETVNHPSHYTHRKHECIDEMVALFGIESVIEFCKCNAWKYRYRAIKKGDYEKDMEKSDWYISKMMELQEKQNRAIEINAGQSRIAYYTHNAGKLNMGEVNNAKN